MQREESQLIEGLFDRLKTTEAQTAPRDREAEALIQQRLREQPAAPYYMAQAMLIQEAAIKRLDQRVKELESQMAQVQQNRPSSGGFLSSLFGGGQSSSAQAPASPASNAAPSRGWNDPGPAAPRPGYGQPNPGYAQPAPGYGQPAPGYAAPQAAPSRMGGFMGGALQTAAGVAGGVLAAQAISGLFHHSQPEEIVNVINETPATDPGLAGGGSQDAWADNASYDNGGGFQDAGNVQDNGGFQDAADYGDTGGGGFFDDNGDDDSFI
ncbi:DUF2076 domain-containing protein [Pseudomonas oryzihabitans]|uniref:DUF2076 domain-containing protein n=1 Tax=Pseudomonas oryzihabitans TaxID=47885 RepID=UPI002895BA4C|nr:DUF2076 domain-containing protein [Pseudomonas oryzihabitans]MDT3719785.1 DUF2076 domain-containing protein [Pseudomonas oryzihabitans]